MTNKKKKAKKHSVYKGKIPRPSLESKDQNEIESAEALRELESRGPSYHLGLLKKQFPHWFDREASAEKAGLRFRDWMMHGTSLKELEANRKLPKETAKRFKEVGEQIEEEDPIFIARFFHPFLPWEFLCSSYDERRKCFFGLGRSKVDDEWGTLSMKPEDLTILGLDRIERDILFREIRFSELEPSLYRQPEGRVK